MATKQEIADVMRFAKCDEKLARRALAATKGKTWVQAVIYAKDELATLSVPTGNSLTVEDLAKTWS